MNYRSTLKTAVTIAALAGIYLVGLFSPGCSPTPPAPDVPITLSGDRTANVGQGFTVTAVESQALPITWDCVPMPSPIDFNVKPDGLSVVIHAQAPGQYVVSAMVATPSAVHLGGLWQSWPAKPYAATWTVTVGGPSPPPPPPLPPNDPYVATLQIAYSADAGANKSIALGNLLLLLDSAKGTVQALDAQATHKDVLSAVHDQIHAVMGNQLQGVSRAIADELNKQLPRDPGGIADAAFRTAFTAQLDRTKQALQKVK